jgi:hypothetical protein
MLTLNTTLETLVLETRANATLHYNATYVDHAPTSFVANSVTGIISTVANTTILTAPAAETQRELKFFSVTNHSSVNTTIVLKRSSNGVSYRWSSPTALRSGESVTYSPRHGIQPYTANGIPYRIGTVTHSVGTITQPTYQTTANLTTNKIIYTGSTHALYLGKAPYSIDGIRVSYNVTTAAATITWAELGLAIGTPVLTGNPTLTPVGYANVSDIVNSTGVKVTPIYITAPYYVQDTDHLWLLIGNQATTECQVKAASITDNVSMGFYASNTSTRPSLTLGTATQYTQESNANNAILCMIAYT